MANLFYKEKAILETLFDMCGGYVMDFSNSTFARFIGDVVNIDVYDGPGYTEYASKANKLRQIWTNEPDNVVGTLLDALLEHCKDYRKRINNLTDEDIAKIGEMKLVAERLKGNSLCVELPQKKEVTMQTLKEDINNALARNKPELVLDRLHTFSTKLLRQICTDNGIATVNDNGDNYPLHSLAGMLKKKYEQNALFQSSFTANAIQNSISLFEKYNAIRNNQSYAHDNPILDKMEAEFAVRIMTDVITFIDRAETYRKQAEKQDKYTEYNLSFPF